MSIFDKLFNSKSQNEDKKESNTVKYNTPDITDYKFGPVNETEMKAFEKYANVIRGFMPLYINDLNPEHNFHPDNLIRYWRIWTKKAEYQKFPPISEKNMVDYLSTCLGMYVRDKFNMTWRYAVDMKTEENGNFTAVGALTNDAINVFFLPKKVMSKELNGLNGIVNIELKRIEDELNNKEMTFEEFVAYAKGTGDGRDVVKVWEYVFKLKEWNFITTFKEDVKECKPFIGVIDEKAWFYMFTDREKAQEFAKKDNRFLGENGECLIITVPVDSAIKMVLEADYQGVFGIKVNENDIEKNSNFNAPISTLKRILQIIKDQNKNGV
jgi:hypothetical protein